MASYHLTGTMVIGSEQGFGTDNRMFQTDLGWWWQANQANECSGPFDSPEAARADYDSSSVPTLKTYDIFVEGDKSPEPIGQVEAVGEMEAMQVAEHEFKSILAKHKKGAALNAVERA